MFIYPITEAKYVIGAVPKYQKSGFRNKKATVNNWFTINFSLKYFQILDGFHSNYIF